ncbi:MAG: electron transfer flavoprotein subunit beta [Clostridia bacterium]|jgi:electron transfer flavoprotein beta subunit|nr:electron transfer flavoprotein subunit beta [Clostridia bacterium]
MHIIVCIKQVPDTEELAKVRINPETNTLIREGVPSIINPFDENAIEEALRLREKKSGEVTVLSMGPPQAEEALRKTLAMGADKAILLSDKTLAGADTLATSYTLAMAIKQLGKFDLILCGKQSIEGDTAQVGPGIAEWLSIPQLTYIRKLEVNDNKVRAERVLEDSFEVVETSLPCLVTVTKDINDPRYPSLRGLLKAKKEEIPIWGCHNLAVERKRVGADGSPTQVIKVFTPQPPGKGEILSGEISEVADRLIREIKKRKIV